MLEKVMELHFLLYAMMILAVVGIIGCMAERLKEKLVEGPYGVDVVAGPDAYRDLPRLVREADTSAMARPSDLTEEIKECVHIRKGPSHTQLMPPYPLRAAGWIFLLSPRSRPYGETNAAHLKTEQFFPGSLSAAAQASAPWNLLPAA